MGPEWELLGSFVWLSMNSGWELYTLEETEHPLKAKAPVPTLTLETKTGIHPKSALVLWSNQVSPIYSLLCYSVSARLAMYARARAGNTLLGLKTPPLRNWMPLYVYSSATLPSVSLCVQVHMLFHTGALI